MTKKIILLLIALLLTQLCYAQSNTIKLLAVTDSNTRGTVVDLELDLVEGHGKVFIETLPLSQIDTQISLRIGKTIACKISEQYCLNKDFFYSISANSPVVAGPSAGAAISLLTMATLENKRIDPKTVITGTINSGGVIGIVGGVKEKIKAAADSGMNRVLIPEGEENSTTLIEYGEELNISVIEVGNIEQAYEIFTNEKIIRKQLEVDENYQKIMKEIAEEICKRTKDLEESIEKIENKNNDSEEFATNLSKESKKLYSNKQYYSSASRCFGTNIYLRNMFLSSINTTKESFEEEINSVRNMIEELENYLNNTKITKLGDLETSMIIMERSYDAKRNLKDAETNQNNHDLSYAIERATSSFAWKRFMGFNGKEIDITKLKNSCVLKIEEVNELQNYISLYFSNLMKDTKKEIDEAKKYHDSGDYALCLFKASKSEAEINMALSALYVENENIKDLLNKKTLAAKNAIEKQIEKGNFPILGYSYYEYANALKDFDVYSALLYAEYGIELSNLDIYFPPSKPFEIRINKKALVTLILGVIIGSLLFSFRKKYVRKRITLRRKYF